MGTIIGLEAVKMENNPPLSGKSAVTLRTTRFNIKKFYVVRGAHIAFMCFVGISEQTATFAL
jgi:hypothetical protein